MNTELYTPSVRPSLQRSVSLSRTASDLHEERWSQDSTPNCPNRPARQLAASDWCERYPSPIHSFSSALSVHLSIYPPPPSSRLVLAATLMLSPRLCVCRQMTHCLTESRQRAGLISRQTMAERVRVTQGRRLGVSEGEAFTHKTHKRDGVCPNFKHRATGWPWIHTTHLSTLPQDRETDTTPHTGNICMGGGPCTLCWCENFKTPFRRNESADPLCDFVP